MLVPYLKTIEIPLSTVFNDQEKDFDNNRLTSLDSITVNKDPTLENEKSNKKYLDDSLGEGSIAIFHQSLQKITKKPMETVKKIIPNKKH